jgi:methionine salvage enolase-phosphatase E1
LPIEIEDPAQELKRNNLIEQKDAENYYMVSIQNYQLQNEPAPIEYVQDNIRNLILNQRKIQFLQQIEENVYKEGLRQNKFKIFVEQAN